MKSIFRVLRWLAIVIVGAFLLLQFIRPARTNPTVDGSLTIHAHLQVTPQVAATLDRSCRDCHSNNTRWPWYSNVAPVSWFVINHVNNGRRALNLSEWGRYDRDRQERKLQQICEEVGDGVMPLSSYTPLHPSARLSPADVKTLCDWTNAERERIASP